jgi:hypothetical protein
LFIFSDLHCEAKTCNQAGTYENILANYCQADFGKYKWKLVAGVISISNSMISHKQTPKLKLLQRIIFFPFSVVKMKFRQARKRSLWGRKVNTVYKTWRGTPSELKKLRKPKLRLEQSENCCSEWIGNKVYSIPDCNLYNELYYKNNNYFGKYSIIRDLLYK